MYRKPRFLEELHAIREEMSRDCDYDVDLFAEMVRSGRRPNYPAETPSLSESGPFQSSQKRPVDNTLKSSEQDAPGNGRNGRIPGVSPTGPEASFEANFNDDDYESNLGSKQ